MYERKSILGTGGGGGGGGVITEETDPIFVANGVTTSQLSTALLGIDPNPFGDAYHLTTVNQDEQTTAKTPTSGTIYLMYTRCHAATVYNRIRYFTGTTWTYATGNGIRTGLYYEDPATKDLTLKICSAFRITAPTSETNESMSATFPDSSVAPTTFQPLLGEWYAFAIMAHWTGGSIGTFRGRTSPTTTGNLNRSPRRVMCELTGQTDLPMTISSETLTASGAPSGFARLDMQLWNTANTNT